MRRLGVVLVAGILSVGGCSHHHPTKYPAQFTSSYLSSCARTSHGQTDYCACTLQYLEDRYSNPGDITTSAYVAAAQSCKDKIH